MNNSTWDVIVAGCGPSGTHAARLLSENGMKTLLIDKMSLPRYKTCGGGLVKRGFDLFQNQLNTIQRRDFCKVQVNDFSLPRVFTLTRSYPIFQMIMRDELDYHLTNAAKSCGACIIENEAINGIDFSEDNLLVHMKHNHFKTKYLIAADGVNSTIAKLSGWKETRKIIPALEYEITLKESDFLSYSDAPRFDFGVIDDGYAWVFPKVNHLSVGLLSMKYLDKSNINQKLEDYISLLGIKDVVEIKKHGYSIPVSPRKDTFAKNNILLTGDAAGLADPITAEGISNAILSGKLAADVIISHFYNPLQVMKLYNTEIKSRIVPELRLAGIIAGLVYRFPTFRRFVLRKYGKIFSELMLAIFCNERTYRQLLTNPFNYLKLLKNSSYS